MAEQSYPFPTGAGAAITVAQYQNMARRFRQTGVIDGSLNELAVSADGSALSVSVATGDAFVEGFFYRNDAAKAMTITTAHATLARIDTVAVRLDRTANAAALAVVTGTAAASPVAPTLTQTDALYELPLADVAVPAAAGVIVSGNVTDRRTLTQTFDSAAFGYTLYTPASDTTFGTTSLTLVDVSATNLLVTFTPPASGKVIVEMNAACNNSSPGRVVWGLRQGTTNLVEGVVMASSTPTRHSLLLPLSGLTPGVPMTLKWAHRAEFTGTAQVLAGPGTPNAGGWGGATMEVRAA